MTASADAITAFTLPFISWSSQKVIGCIGKTRCIARFPCDSTAFVL